MTVQKSPQTSISSFRLKACLSIAATVNIAGYVLLAEPSEGHIHSTTFMKPHVTILNYLHFENINFELMIIIGLLCYGTFLKHYKIENMDFAILYALVAVQLAIIIEIVVLWFETAQTYTSHLTYSDLANGAVLASSLLIALGPMHGYLTADQLIFMMCSEMLAAGLNNAILKQNLKVMDFGGALRVHIFGALFGISAFKTFEGNRGSMVYKKKSKECIADQNNRTELESFIGTILIWILHLSSTCTQSCSNAMYFRAVINTILGLVGSIAGTLFVVRLRTTDQVMIQHLESGSIAGGVIVSCSAAVCIYPVWSVALGFIAGVIAAAKYKFLSAEYESRRLFIVHLIPGVISAVAVIPFILLVESGDDQAFVDDLPLCFPVLQVGHRLFYQAWMQLVGISCTMLLAMFSGSMAGLVMSSSMFIHSPVCAGYRLLI